MFKKVDIYICITDSRICLQCKRTGFDPGLGRSPRGGHGHPLQYSCLENRQGQKRLAHYNPWGHRGQTGLSD